jgi:hypothetical protein
MSEQPVMPVMGAHYCTGCGQIHGTESQDAAVRIAEIEANRAIEVARIERGEFQHNAEISAETEIAVAEIQATAGVAETEALAEGIADAGGDDAVPLITDVAVPDAEPEVQASIEPRDDDAGGDDIPPPAKSKSSLSYWP